MKRFSLFRTWTAVGVVVCSLPQTTINAQNVIPAPPADYPPECYSFHYGKGPMTKACEAALKKRQERADKKDARDTDQGEREKFKQDCGEKVKEFETARAKLSEACVKAGSVFSLHAAERNFGPEEGRRLTCLDHLYACKTCGDPSQEVSPLCQGSEKDESAGSDSTSGFRTAIDVFGGAVSGLPSAGQVPQLDRRKAAKSKIDQFASCRLRTATAVKGFRESAEKAAQDRRRLREQVQREQSELISDQKKSMEAQNQAENDLKTAIETAEENKAKLTRSLAAKNQELANNISLAIAKHSEKGSSIRELKSQLSDADIGYQSVQAEVNNKCWDEAAKMIAAERQRILEQFERGQYNVESGLAALGRVGESEAKRDQRRLDGYYKRCLSSKPQRDRMAIAQQTRVQMKKRLQDRIAFEEQAQAQLYAEIQRLQTEGRKQNLEDAVAELGTLQRRTENSLDAITKKKQAAAQSNGISYYQNYTNLSKLQAELADKEDQFEVEQALLSAAERESQGLSRVEDPTAFGLAETAFESLMSAGKTAVTQCCLHDDNGGPYSKACEQVCKPMIDLGSGERSAWSLVDGQCAKFKPDSSKENPLPTTSSPSASGTRR